MQRSEDHHEHRCQQEREHESRHHAEREQAEDGHETENHAKRNEPCHLRSLLLWNRPGNACTCSLAIRAPPRQGTTNAASECTQTSSERQDHAAFRPEIAWRITVRSSILLRLS